MSDCRTLLETLSDERTVERKTTNDLLELYCQLKNYSRNPELAEQFTYEYVERFIKIALRKAGGLKDSGQSDELRLNALTVCANALLLNHSLKSRSWIAVLELLIKEFDQSSSSSIYEFALSRVLFLITFARNDEYIAKVPSLVATLRWKVAEYQLEKGENIIIEYLKIATNLSYHYPDDCRNLAFITLKLFELILDRNVTERLKSTCLSTLVVLPLEYQDILKSESAIHRVVDQVLDDLDQQLKKTDKSVMNSTAGPQFDFSNVGLEEYDYILLSFVLKITIYCVQYSEIDESSTGPQQGKSSAAPTLLQHLKKCILPSESDRQAELGVGNTLPNRLLRLVRMNDLRARDMVMDIYYKLCEENGELLISTVGYGLCAWYIAKNNIPVETGYAETSYSHDSNSPNIITGKLQDGKTNDAVLDDMTEEEKLQEAEKLFVLFERIKKNGVIKVENPIIKAKQEGKFD